MAYITKRGSSYSVRYTYQDEHGKSCDKWESFPTKEEAVKRQKQIEHELATGNFLIPSTVTVAEFLMDWLPKQCSKHKWAPKTYQSNLALIQNLIIPYIGEMQMQKLRPYHIEALYDTLSKTPCGQYVGGKRRDLSPKQQKRTLSGTTLHEVHQLLHNSFLLAVEWGILIKSPVPVEAPKKTTQERSIWEVEEMRAALDSMEDPILHLAVHLTLVGALREGEVAGLTPEDIDFDAANGMGTFTVNRSMQRVQKDTLAQVDKGCILRIFPDKLEGSKTSLILKDTKTEASCRTIFMTAALREELKQCLERCGAQVECCLVDILVHLLEPWHYAEHHVGCAEGDVCQYHCGESLRYAEADEQQEQRHTGDNVCIHHRDGIGEVHYLPCARAQIEDADGCNAAQRRTGGGGKQGNGECVPDGIYQRVVHPARKQGAVQLGGESRPVAQHLCLREGEYHNN